MINYAFKVLNKFDDVEVERKGKIKYIIDDVRRACGMEVKPLESEDSPSYYIKEAIKNITNEEYQLLPLASKNYLESLFKQIEEWDHDDIEEGNEVALKFTGEEWNYAFKVLNKFDDVEVERNRGIKKIVDDVRRACGMEVWDLESRDSPADYITEVIKNITDKKYQSLPLASKSYLKSLFEEIKKWDHDDIEGGKKVPSRFTGAEWIENSSDSDGSPTPTNSPSAERKNASPAQLPTKQGPTQ